METIIGTITVFNINDFAKVSKSTVQLFFTDDTNIFILNTNWTTLKTK